MLVLRESVKAVPKDLGCTYMHAHQAAQCPPGLPCLEEGSRGRAAACQARRKRARPHRPGARCTWRGGLPISRRPGLRGNPKPQCGVDMETWWLERQVTADACGLVASGLGNSTESCSSATPYLAKQPQRVELLPSAGLHLRRQPSTFIAQPLQHLDSCWATRGVWRYALFYQCQHVLQAGRTGMNHSTTLLRRRAHCGPETE